MVVSFVSAFYTSTAYAKVTVINHVKGYTLQTSKCESCVDNLNDQWQQFSSIAFENGKVINISLQDLAKQFKGAEVIDGQGMVMLPGLIDAHGHILNLGKSRLEVDVRGIDSVEKTAKAIAEYGKQNPQLSWVKGRGWNQELWKGKQYPTAKDLDEYFADKPVWITRVDGHAGWANRQALAFAGINKATVDPDGC